MSETPPASSQSPIVPRSITKVTKRLSQQVLQGYDPVDKYTVEATERMIALNPQAANKNLVVKGTRRARQLFESPRSTVYFMLPDEDPEWKETRPEAHDRLNRLLKGCVLLVKVLLELIPDELPTSPLLHIDIILRKDALTPKAALLFGDFLHKAFPLAQFLNEPLRNCSKYFREQVLRDLCSRKQSLREIGYTKGSINIYEIQQAVFHQIKSQV